jgi:transcriptional regulator with XRE-family HTH domain
MTLKEKKQKELFLKQFGDHLKKLRMEKGISGAELSRMLFMDKPNLTRLEKGRVNPSLYILKQISEALNISLDEMFRDL